MTPLQAQTAPNPTPTQSRGRPAVPVYWVGATEVLCYQRVVDNSVGVDNSGVTR
jgi:hypothetical protein